MGLRLGLLFAAAIASGCGAPRTIGGALVDASGNDAMDSTLDSTADSLPASSLCGIDGGAPPGADSTIGTIIGATVNASFCGGVLQGGLYKSEPPADPSKAPLLMVLSETPSLVFRAPDGATAGYVNVNVGFVMPEPETHSSADPASCGEISFCIAVSPNPPIYPCGQWPADSCPAGCAVLGSAMNPRCDWTVRPLCYVAQSGGGCRSGAGVARGSWTVTTTSLESTSDARVARMHGTLTARMVPDSIVGTTDDATLTMTF